ACGRGAGGGGHRRSLGDEGVAGLVDGEGDVGSVDRLRGGDRDAAGRQVDGDAADAGDPADLLGHGALAVAAGHAGDLERGGADEGARRVLEHVSSLRYGSLSPPGPPAHTGEIAGFCTLAWVLVGRDAERAGIAALLEAARGSSGGALVVRGVAGSGKSALLA